MPHVPPSVHSSRAVLSALRALQDKIRRLEVERAEYAQNSKSLEIALKEYRQQLEAERLKSSKQTRELDERRAVQQVSA